MAGVPLTDDYPTRRVPAVTYLLVATNVLVYLLSPLSQIARWYGEGHARACAVEEYVARWAAVPAELLSGFSLSEAVTISGNCAIAPFDKSPLVSAFSAMFLHGSALHLLGNMVFLFVFGPFVEDRLGRYRYLFAYLAFGLVATYGYALTNADSTVPLVGASGAISGVLGAYLVLQPGSRVTTLIFGFIPFRLPAWVSIGSWLIGQYVLLVSQWVLPAGSQESGVAYAAHVYGFLAGVAGGFLQRRMGRSRRLVALRG